MAKYFARKCPRCSDYMGVVIPEGNGSLGEIYLDARCLHCGFKLEWSLIPGSGSSRSVIIKPLAALLGLVLLAFPVFLRGEICPNSQVSKANLQTFDSALSLPLAAKFEAEVSHLPWGFPGQKRLLYHREFIVSYDTERRIPSWVAYRLKAEDIVKRPRLNSFRTDPRLSANETATCADYEEPVFDRGHLVPNADMLRTPEAQAYTFFLSNMAPQFAKFNRGIWAYFEDLVREWAKARGSVYVISGGVFDRDGDGKPDTLNQTQWVPSKRVGIPTHFYKIILSPSFTLDSISIMLPHTDVNPSDRLAYLRKNIVSIGEIQKRTGLGFLLGLGPLSRETVETAVAPNLWPRQ